MADYNENRIRQIVNQELDRRANSSRFNLNPIPNHAHTGTDSSPRIREEDLIPNASIVGSIEFSTIQQYTIRLNASFTPRSIQIYGVLVGVENGDPVRGIVVGSAQLTPTFYLQDPTSADTPDNYVVTGELQFPFVGNTGGANPVNGSGIPAQTCAWFKAASIAGSDDYRAAVSEDHIVSVTYAGTIWARATVIGFSKNEIIIDVPYLEPDWSMFISFVIT